MTPDNRNSDSTADVYELRAGGDAPRGTQEGPVNRRILVIDDNPRIHDDFRTILVRDQEGVDFLLDLEAELFGDPEPHRSAEVSFEVDSAYQGREGVEMVEEALEDGRPYAMAFVDVRMPPGWDGIETIKRMWEIDPDIEVVICTAYSDYSWEETVEILDPAERFLILKKPFDTVVVRQLAHSLTEKWQRKQSTKEEVDQLRSTVSERSRDLEDVQKRLREEKAERERVESALRQAWELDEDAPTEMEALRAPFNELSELLSSYSALLARGDDASDPAARRLLDEIPEAVSRTLQGIEQVGNMVQALREAGAEPPEHQLREADPNALVARALAETVDDYALVADVQGDYGDVPSIRCWSDDVVEALVHLIRNAAHAVGERHADDGEKGTIEVATRTGRGGAVVITITDDGTGIPEEVQDRIFEPFFSTHDGSGQGLPVVREIVQDQHGGSIEFESRTARGTTFEIRLPSEPPSRS